MHLNTTEHPVEQGLQYFNCVCFYDTEGLLRHPLDTPGLLNHSDKNHNSRQET